MAAKNIFIKQKVLTKALLAVALPYRKTEIMKLTFLK